ncbi:MAG: CHAD domain-containing protein, partial [Magnetococcales bacterium]|nr:CHAD domain-containing protein [Magnetococcales bacterium]
MALPLNKMIRLDLSSVPLPAGAGPLLLAHPIVRAVGGAVQLQERNEIHYDTPTLQLYRHHVLLTLNRRGEQWVQRCGMEDGPEQDKKWVESPVPDQQLDLKMIRKIPNCPVLNGNDTKNLAPVFTFHCREQKWSLSFPGGGTIHLREERGYIKLGATRQPFHELVFEHQAGSMARWFQTVLAFAYTFFLNEKTGHGRNGSFEKSGPGLLSTNPVTRGFAWLDPTLLMPTVAAVAAEGKEGTSGEGAVGDAVFPKLQGEMTAHRAFEPLCGGLLQRMQAHQSTVLYGGKQAKLEGVRLLQQKAGRLHTLILLYQPLLPKEIYGDLEQESAWLLKELGLVQECQTLLVATLEPLLEQFAGHPGLEELLLKTKNGLLLAVKRLEKCLTSFRYARLILGLEQWIFSGQWEFLADPLQQEGLEMPIARLVTDGLQQDHGQLRKRGRLWSEMDWAARSGMRADVDRMVHSTELFVDLFVNNKRLKQAGGRAAFQDNLLKLQSALHNLVHLQGSSRLLARGVSNKESGGVHPILEWQETRIHRYLLEAT